MGAQSEGPVHFRWARLRFRVSNMLLSSQLALAPKWHRAVCHAWALTRYVHSLHASALGRRLTATSGKPSKGLSRRTLHHTPARLFPSHRSQAAGPGTALAWGCCCVPRGSRAELPQAGLSNRRAGSAPHQPPPAQAQPQGWRQGSVRPRGLN